MLGGYATLFVTYKLFKSPAAPPKPADPNADKELKKLLASIMPDAGGAAKAHSPVEDWNPTERIEQWIRGGDDREAAEFAPDARQ